MVGGYGVSQFDDDLAAYAIPSLQEYFSSDEWQFTGQDGTELDLVAIQGPVEEEIIEDTDGRA
jgi:hypothetical protein